MSRLERSFEAYDAFHRNPANKVTHYLGIPLIVIAVLGLLSHLRLFSLERGFQLDWGMALWALASLWYIGLSFRLGLSFALLLAGAYFTARTIPIPLLWGFFVVGWALQLYGHYVFEKKSPAFLKNIEHLLIGPLWIFARLLK